MKKVTMRDVAERAGCSKATVSYCITNRRSISEETKARVRKAMNELNYHPNLRARNFSKNGNNSPFVKSGSKKFFSYIGGTLLWQT